MILSPRELPFRPDRRPAQVIAGVWFGPGARGQVGSRVRFQGRLSWSVDSRLGRGPEAGSRRELLTSTIAEASAKPINTIAQQVPAQRRGEKPAFALRLEVPWDRMSVSKIRVPRHARDRGGDGLDVGWLPPPDRQS